MCSFNKSGFWKFGEKCRKKHIKELCQESSCDSKKMCTKTSKRMQVFENIGYCKFGERCLLSHNIKKDPNIENLEKEYKNVRNKLEKLEKLIDEKDKQMENIIESMLHKFRKLE